MMGDSVRPNKDVVWDFRDAHNCGKKIAAEINENRGECGSNKDLRGSILRFGQAAEEYFEQIDSRNGKDQSQPAGL